MFDCAPSCALSFPTDLHLTNYARASAMFQCPSAAQIAVASPDAIVNGHRPLRLARSPVASPSSISPPILLFTLAIIIIFGAGGFCWRNCRWGFASAQGLRLLRRDMRLLTSRWHRALGPKWLRILCLASCTLLWMRARSWLLFFINSRGVLYGWWNNLSTLCCSPKLRFKLQCSLVEHSDGRHAEA